MPATKDPTELQYTGETPLRSNITAHPSDAQEMFVNFIDLFCDGPGRIRKRRGKVQVGTTRASGITSMWEYEYVNPATGVSTYFTFITVGATIQRWTGAAWSAESLPIALTSTARPAWLNIRNRVLFCNGTDPELVFDGTNWRVLGQDAPAALPLYVLNGVYSTGTVDITVGSANIVGSIGAIWSVAWNGKFIDINGQRYTISAVTTLGDGFTIAPAATLTEKVKEATALLLPYKIYSGVMDWSVGPRYSYAYYNPTTGHVTNESPVVEVVEKDQLGVTPRITITGSGANTSAYNAGYTQIKIFRPPKNAFRRVAINVVVNNVNTGANIVYDESTSTNSDTNLTELAAPINTNVKPLPGIAAFAEFQGRAWGVKPADDPPGVYFSAINEELPFGRGEESWPARFKRITTRPTGILSIGSPGISNSLIIQTGNGDFTVDGFDNKSYTNPLLMPTRHSGGFLGGAVEARGNLVQFYRDKRLFDYGPRRSQSGTLLGGGADLGYPIQDKLNLLNGAALTGSKLAWHAYESLDLLVLAVPKGAAQTTNNYSFVYDYDKGLLYEWNFGFSAAATVHNTTSGALELWVGDSVGNVYTLLASNSFDDAGSQFAPSFKTAHIRREEGMYRLAHVKLFVGPVASNPQNLTWTVNIYVDESTTVSYTYVATAVPAMWQSSQGLELWIAPEKAIRSNVFQVEVVFPTTATDLSIDKMVVVLAPDAEDEVEP